MTSKINLKVFTCSQAVFGSRGFCRLKNYPPEYYNFIRREE
jgi:hypothetical protein